MKKICRRVLDSDVLFGSFVLVLVVAVAGVVHLAVVVIGAALDRAGVDW